MHPWGIRHFALNLGGLLLGHEMTISSPWVDRWQSQNR